MIIGVPTEVKNSENRVALTPAGTMALKQAGHQVLVQAGAGLGSGMLDDEYAAAGAEIVHSAEETWARAEMVVKVKEPIPSEYKLLRSELLLFTYLHLAASSELTEALLQSGVTAIAYETIQMPDRTLPLLTPMSEIAGRMSVQAGAYYLEKAHGGRGVLLGGVPGVPPADVVIIGGGVSGTHAAKMALGLGAQVQILDINLDRLRYLEDVLHGRVITQMSSPLNIARAVRGADLVIGAVLIPGAKAPCLVTHEMIKGMKKGSVVVDIAIDQGGCIETIHSTTHADPVYEVDGVIHYGVANIPGAVPRTSTFALNNATLPYMLQLANKGADMAMAENSSLALGLNVRAGKITHAAVESAYREAVSA
ncbi:MAG: alanine dehydrogenase [Candidatus Sericytochromatia bacterium]|nr:alanine dehydrogenase [Candidatus Sericytochromatia bacterium]